MQALQGRALDVQNISAQVNKLLSKNHAARDLLGEGVQVKGVRAVADQQINSQRILQITFIAQGARAYGDILVTVNGSGEETVLSRAILNGPNGRQVVLADGGAGGGAGRKTWTHTVDV